jgi:hypothetical protein
LVNSENPRQSAGHESFSGTLAHLYSGAIHLKFPLGRSLKTGRMESQANFLGALNPTLEKMYSSTFAGAKNVLLDIPPQLAAGEYPFGFDTLQLAAGSFIILYAGYPQFGPVFYPVSRVIRPSVQRM